MKKLSYLLGFMLVATFGLTTFTSCEDDDTTVVGPSLTLVAETDYISADATVEPGTTLMFKVDVRKGDANLDILTVTKAGVNLASSPYEDIDNSADVVEVEFAAETNAGTYAYVFEVTDKDAETASKSITITIAEEETAMTDAQAGYIYHLWGAGNGAWDLNASAEKMVADDATVKDMINTTVATGDTFVHGWVAGEGNNTMYVKANDFDYANPTVEAATTAYDAGTAAAEVSDVVVDDIYIAKLRGGSDYAVIKITEVSDDANPPLKAGSGKISFTYIK